MTEFTERLSRMTIRVLSPDCRMKATLHPARQLDFKFVPDAFSQYRQNPEPVLERQLVAVATRLWTGYQRGFTTLLSEAPGEPPAPPRSTTAAADLEPDRRRFRDSCARIVGLGEGLGGLIKVTTTGLVRWDFSIRRGTLDRTNESTFRRELLAAAQPALDGYFKQVRELKDTMYGDPAGRTELGPWLR